RAVNGGYFPEGLKWLSALRSSVAAGLARACGGACRALAFAALSRTGLTGFLRTSVGPEAETGRARGRGTWATGRMCLTGGAATDAGTGGAGDADDSADDAAAADAGSVGVGIAGA